MGVTHAPQRFAYISGGHHEQDSPMLVRCRTFLCHCTDGGPSVPGPVISQYHTRRDCFKTEAKAALRLPALVRRGRVLCKGRAEILPSLRYVRMTETGCIVMVFCTSVLLNMQSPWAQKT